jgi:soluble lytic murein transglycosylase-like protein
LKILASAFLIFAFGLTCFLGGVVVGVHYKEIPNTIEKYIVVPPLSREEITNRVERYIASGNHTSVVRFYNGYSKNTSITNLVIHAADVYNIPINTLMAMIWMESGFRPDAVNGHLNRDGSNDVGLMQLNSNYFKKVDRYDPRANLRAGCEHLVKLRERYGSWDAAILFYNGFSKEAVKYQSRVLAKERELDREFYKARI